MNICMFTNTFLPHVGGVARSVAAFAEDLRGLGHRVLVVAPTFPKHKASGSVDDGVLRVPALQNFNGSDFSVRIAIPFLIDREIDAFGPDIVHSHHPFLLGDAALRAAVSRGLPLVFTHHTLYERYTHYVPFDSKAMARFAIRLSTEYANLCTRVVAPSESIAELIAGRGVKRPVDVVPTGVDLDFFARGRGERLRKRYRIGGDELVIGHVGRLASEKNLAFLAEAVARYLAESEGARFLVVGGGPAEEAIRRILADRGCADRLVMTGPLGGDELADAYQAMDCFVFASHTETQGMVLTEAMAAELPVIALDASGSREVVADGVNGRLLPADADPAAFAEAIGALAEDPDTAGAWRRAAKRTAERFSRQNCARRLVACYQQAMAASNGAGREHSAWEGLLGRLRAEWELLVEKAAAAVETIEEQGEGEG